MDFKEQVYSVLFISAAEKFNTSVSELLPDYRYWISLTHQELYSLQYENTRIIRFLEYINIENMEASDFKPI